MSVLRFDQGRLQKPVKMDNGWLRADGFLSRTGVFTYRNPDGSTRRELRLPEEVFRGDALGSFNLLPVTDNHPAEMLTAENTKEFQRGTVAEARRDDDKMRGSLLITDKELITKLGSGKTQVSCGYTCDLEHTPGEFNGEKYDAVQRNIRGNHVAVVAAGRAGADVRIRMDKDDAYMVHFLHSDESSEEIEQMAKINIDGVEYEVSEQVEQAYAKARKDSAEKLDAATQASESKAGEVDTLQAKLDAATEELEKERQARADAEDPAKLRVRIEERIALEASAKRVLGEDVKFDAKSDHEIRLDACQKASPDFDFEGKSDEYVQARFDAALEAVASAPNPALGNLRKDAENVDAAGTEKDPEAAARKAMNERHANAWKTLGKAGQE